jgi:hypothetical protein
MTGFYGPKDEWEKLEAPIKKIDSQVDAFAKIYGLEQTRNHKSWPERSLMWKSNEMSHLIQIYMDGKETERYNLWLATSKDIGKDRYWKNVFLKKNASIDEIAEDLFENLEKAKKEIESWKESDLENSNRKTKRG